jgi:hypothetical protein
MKKTLNLLILAIGLFSCQNQPKEVEETSVDHTETTELDNSQYHTQEDTLYIVTEINDTWKYSKEEFNSIVDRHPEFFMEYPRHPDQVYSWSNKDDAFTSQFGIDDYYVLYAYFLKQRNGEQEYVQQRQQLIDIFMLINSLFASINYGGSYFGHQIPRILAYAEYSVYQLKQSGNNLYQMYNIKKQKDLYIQSLRQIIADEIKIDERSIPYHKLRRSEEFNGIVDELDKLLTDRFYLRQAQEFHYQHY